MSIEIMTRVWKQSKQGGSQLLLLLAIADNANDGGFAWPGQEYLAKKIRMSAKSIPRLTKKLQEAGELFIHNRADLGKVTQYIVMVGMDWDQLEQTLRQYLKFDEAQLSVAKREYIKTTGGDKLGGGQAGGGTQLCPGGVDIAVRGGVDIAVSTEPSLIDIETSFLETSQKSLSALVDPSESDKLNTLADQIAEVCDNINLETAHPSTKEEIKRITISLYKINATKDDLKNFAPWWYDNTWQGKKGQAPTPKQLGDKWGQFEAQKVINVPAIDANGGLYV